MRIEIKDQDMESSFGEILSSIPDIESLSETINEIIATLNGMSPEIEFYTEFDYDGDVRFIVREVREVRVESRENRPEGRAELMDSSVPTIASNGDSRFCLGFISTSGGISFRGNGRSVDIHTADDLRTAISENIQTNEEHFWRLIVNSRFRRGVSAEERERPRDDDRPEVMGTAVAVLNAPTVIQW